MSIFQGFLCEKVSTFQSFYTTKMRLSAHFSRKKCDYSHIISCKMCDFTNQTIFLSLVCLENLVPYISISPSLSALITSKGSLLSINTS